MRWSISDQYSNGCKWKGNIHMMSDTVQKERELLLKVLGTARNYAEDVLDINQRITAKTQEIEAYQKWGEERICKFFYHRYWLVDFLVSIVIFIGGYFVLGYSICGIAYSINPDIGESMMGIILLVCDFTLCIAYLVYRFIQGNKAFSKFMNEWETTGKQKLDDMNTQLQELYAYRKELAKERAATTLSLLPPKYTYLEAIDFFIDVIVNLRADSMKEAVNLYEEHLHRQRMEAAQNKLAEQQAKMLQLQGENQAILNSISQSAQSANLSAQRIESDVHTLETLAMIQYLKK